MRIRVTAANLHSENTKRVEVAQKSYLLPEDLPPLPGGLAGRSATALERELRDGGVSYVVADDAGLRIVADHRGNRHLYCHRAESAAGPELMITDDLLSFAGLLPIDDDVARLVPLMKFVPPPLCLLQGAERVPPGVARVFDRRTLRPVKDDSFLSELFGGGATPVGHDEVRDTLAAIVAEEARHLSTAVVFLSGGSDSALLVHLLKQCGHPPQTWTATFDTPAGRREAGLAASTASRYGATWRPVNLDKQAALRHLPAILGAMKEPFADVALVPEAVLGLSMREAMGEPSGPIPVFEGEGMDSLMCGSYKFVAEHYRSLLSPLLAGLPKAALTGADRRTGWGSLKLKTAQTKALLRGGTLFERHLRFLLDDQFSTYVPSPLWDKVVATFRSYYDLLPQLEPLNRVAIMTFQGNLPNLENRKLRVVAECAGIDFHLAYQDPRFIRLALSTPVREKIGRGYGKRIIKEAFRDDLPPHVLTRRKGSFVPPVLDWVCPEHEELLLGSRLFERGEIGRRLREHVAGRQDHLPFLWGVLVTSSWMETYESHESAAQASLASEPPHARAEAPQLGSADRPSRPATHLDDVPPL
jgi:asparagine synthetase B (glutamine-hydrolysing)